MCISPIKILNKSKAFSPLVDKAYIEVPCGHCWQCVKKKANDWFLRVSYEFVDTAGDTLFPTLTYNNFHLPHIDLSSDKYRPLIDEVKFDVPSDSKSITCFNKSHIVKFNKSFRQYLDKSKNYSFIHNDLSDFQYKFFSVCEMGTNMHRPHVHTLLHFNKKIVENASLFSDIDKLLQLAWSESVSFDSLPLDLQIWINTNEDIIHKKGFVIPQHLSYDYIIYSVSGKLWYMHRYGFVSWPSNSDGTLRPALEGVGGAKYVSKYLTKMFIFDRNDKFSAVKALISKCRPYEGEFTELYKSLRASLPFVHCSKGYGKIIEQKVIEKTKIEDFRRALFITAPSDTNHEYSVPTYIINRLFYQKQHYENDVYFTKLTPLGVKLYQFRLLSVAENLMEKARLLTLNEFTDLFPNIEKDDLFLYRQLYKCVAPDFFALYTLCLEWCPYAPHYINSVGAFGIELLHDFLHSKAVAHSENFNHIYEKGWCESSDSKRIKDLVAESQRSYIFKDVTLLKNYFNKIYNVINDTLSSSELEEEKFKYIVKSLNQSYYV